MPVTHTDADAIVDRMVDRIGPRLVVGAPLGLGKANRILDALYARARSDGIELIVHTALGLVAPQPASALEARLRDPINDRVFGGYVAPQIIVDMRNDELPDNVVVHSFFFQPGALLNSRRGRLDRINANYSDVERRIDDLDLDAFVQMVAPGPESADGDDRYSLSCNPDLTLSVLRHLEQRRSNGENVMMCGEVNRNLPWMGGDAAIERDAFDMVLETPPPDPTLFAMPNMPVTTVDHSIGAHAASLIRDGGTIQLGIGALGDALAWMMIVRHLRPDRFARLVSCLGDESSPAIGGVTPFDQGLYAASEMFVPGLLELFEAGILSRRVFDDIDTQRDEMSDQDRATTHGHGHVAHAGFFLGPQDFYRRLREMDPERRRLIAMTGIENINTLDEDRELRVLQRRDARFVNTAINVTLDGAIASDTLDDGRVVSGVGGQFDFVEMARRLPGARSIILLRSTRNGGTPQSNIVLDHRHVTCPAHLRDIVVTEYGVADLRSCSDSQVAARLVEIADSRFQSRLVEQACAAGLLPANHVIETRWRNNTPDSLRLRWNGHEQWGPALPFDSELDDDEIQLGRALQHLDTLVTSKDPRLVSRRALTSILVPPRGARPLLARMNLESPSGLREHLERRLVAYAVAASGGSGAVPLARRPDPLSRVDVA